MIYNKGIRWIALTSLVLLPLLTTGCGLFKQGADQEIDPPQFETAEEWGVDVGAANDLFVDGTTQVTLYFKDEEGFVAPISMDLPQVEGIAKQALAFMVAGGPVESMLPQGFTALIPQGTEIAGMDIVPEQKLAIVDFTESFAHYNAQDERKILEAVTWMLTGFPSIEHVQIWVDGRVLKEMPVDGTPIEEPLSRAMGINIERSQGVDLGQSSPVTLYFLNETSSDFQYYVPVTRMIERTEDIALAAVAELIKGPNEASHLQQVMMPAAELLTIDHLDELITVNFNELILSADQQAPSELIQSVILSLTESTGAQMVQIKVNGDNYTVPVTRPAYVNPFKL